MTLGLSTHLFLPLRLHAGLLDSFKSAGATAIQIVAARHHFDYTDRPSVRDLAAWFHDNGVEARLHAPLYPAGEWSRHVDPSLNLISPDKARRIDAMDETKRALEAAEQIPFRAVTLHLGLRNEKWSQRALENSLTAIEHLNAFARPLGLQLLLENLQNEVTAPEHLLEILRAGHFDDVGVALDVGHAHLTDYQNPGAGIDAAFELLRHRIGEIHLHDNHGHRDEHLWPGEGSIDRPNLFRHLDTLPPQTPVLLEIAHERNTLPADLPRKLADLRSTHEQAQAARVSIGTPQA